MNELIARRDRSKSVGIGEFIDHLIPLDRFKATRLVEVRAA